MIGYLLISLPGLIVLGFTLSEFYDEWKFKQNGIATFGTVVGKILARHPSKANMSYHGSGSAYTPETKGGYFFAFRI